MNIDREILRLTIPAILSNVTVPLLALCDTAISGHLGSPSYLAAISVATMMLNVVYWLCGFLRMGTTGLTAQAFGKGDREECRSLLTRSITISAAAGFLLLLLSEPLMRLLLLIISPGDEVRELVESYYRICIIAAPPTLATMAISGWLLGLQTTLLPMIISLSVNVCNIALSIIFVFVLDMGFDGVAAGTCTASWGGLLLAVLLAVRKFGGNPFINPLKLKGSKDTSRFFKVNSDIFFRSACIMAVSLSVTSFGAANGPMTLAINAVMMQFFTFFSYFMDGFAFTGEALCGRFAGARDRVMLIASVRHLLWWSAGVAVIFTLIYICGWNTIAGLITDDRSVTEEIRRYSGFLIMIPPLTVAAFIFDGFFIGLTATRRMLISTVAAALVFFAVSLSGDPVFSPPDNTRLWTAFLSYLVCRGLLLALQTRKIINATHLSV